MVGAARATGRAARSQPPINRPPTAHASACTPAGSSKLPLPPSQVLQRLLANLSPLLEGTAIQTL